MVFDLLLDRDRRRNLTRTSTRWTDVCDFDLRFGSDSLTRNLHQPELRQRQHRMLSTVLSHRLLHHLIQRISIFGFVHIDEVDYHDSAHIPESELARNFVYCVAIHLKRRILGRKGHLNNEDCAKVLVPLIRAGTKAVFLSHLSQDNNLPELAYNTVCGALAEAGYDAGVDVRVTVSRRDKVSDMLVLSDGVED